MLTTVLKNIHPSKPQWDEMFSEKSSAVNTTIFDFFAIVHFQMYQQIVE